MSNKQYTASSIQALEGMEHVRMRPSMYIGDVGVRGLHHLVYEVVDNSIDEALAGYCDTITVTIHEGNSITVTDNGRGIPVDFHEKEQKSALEVVMTKIGAGGKFDKDSYKVSGGLHGVGVSCVNALSTDMTTRVYRDGKIYQQKYQKGKAITAVEEVGISDKRGTEQFFQPDDTIFNELVYNYDTLANRLRELSFLNKGITIKLTDEREKGENGNFKSETFFSEGGLKEFVEYIDGNRVGLMAQPIYIESRDEDEIPVEVAMRYNDSFSENLHSYVNNINTHEGGTHLAGFRRALTTTLKKYAEDLGIPQKEKVEISGEDFREGLTAIVSVKVMEPQFEGQTKTKLGNSEVSGAVSRVVSEMLTNFLEENPAEAKVIVQKVILAAKARIAAKKARETVQRQTPLWGGGLPGKLSDCSSTDPSVCELFLVEGDSAGGTARQGRNSEFQAILPLKGKILNVEKALTHKVYDSDEIKNIYTALGVSVGTEEDPKALNLSKLRYHKVVMTDADVDGSHISTLILTFFFRYMRELIDNGYVYIATPPLYQLRKGKTSVYAWNDKDRDEKAYQLSPDGKVEIQRYKGLGEMNAEQLAETTMNPENRFLKQVNIENAAEADRVFSMLRGDEVPPRGEFIEQNARYANIDA